MTAVKANAFRVFDLLSDSEQNLVYELMIRLAPDDVATPEDLADIAAAREEYRRGETFNDDDIDWS
jgi:hypothetical protein